ncbi:MAG: glycosyltransferase family 9 protein [Bacteroidales bacterium]|nr:glycosyltransferase family 9 protein [Bacteroidales bacterium]MBN2697624.1 glycosyltransferase family 9 protein [Bacteroidales bacterium]
MISFLIIRFSSIGDIVLTTPIVRILKTQVGDSVIHYLTKEQYAPILESNPYIDHLHLYSGNLNEFIRQLKAEPVDYIIDLHHNIRSAIVKNRLGTVSFVVNKINFRKWLLVHLKIDRMPGTHIVDRYLKTIELFDVKDDGRGLDYFIPPAEEVDIAALGDVFNQGYIALAIGARHNTKKLPREKLVELAGLIEHPIIIVGGPEDREVGEFICSASPSKAIFNASGGFSVNQSASIIRQSRLVITHDTGMMHIAAAFKKKILSVWGNTVPAFGMAPYRADRDSVIFEVKGLRCRPCSKIGYRTCPRKHFRCMNEQDIPGIADKANHLFTGQ